MNEGTHIESWLRNKGFPIPFNTAQIFKWYNDPIYVAKDNGIPLEEAEKFLRSKVRPEMVVDPRHCSICLDCTVEENLEGNEEIIAWVHSVFSDAEDCGVYDDRGTGELIVDILISWEKLTNKLSE